MKSIVIALFLFHSCLVSPGQEKIPVFKSGTEGYKSFRIPAIIRIPGGNLLAFCEGRVDGSADFGNIDIVMKRSSDNGKTWGALQVVAEMDSLQAGNPAPVVNLTDPAYPDGRIFLFYIQEIIMRVKSEKGMA
jgi:sialidase-1